MHIRQVNKNAEGRCNSMETGKEIFPKVSDAIFSSRAESFSDCLAYCNLLNCPTACIYGKTDEQCSCVQQLPIKLVDGAETQYASFCSVLGSPLSYGGSRGIWTIQGGVLKMCL